MTEPDPARIAWNACAAARYDDEENGNPLGLPQGMPNFEDFKDGYRAGAAASAERIKELEAQVEVLDWLTYQTDLQLSWDADPEEDWAWRVHGVTGNVNDREWRLIAEGETPLAALKNARALLKEPDQ